MNEHSREVRRVPVDNFPPRSGFSGAVTSDDPWLSGQSSRDITVPTFTVWPDIESMWAVSRLSEVTWA